MDNLNENLVDEYIQYKIQIDNTENVDKKKKLQIEMCYIEDLLNGSDIPEHIINNLYDISFQFTNNDDGDYLKLNEKKETLKEKINKLLNKREKKD